MRMRRKLLDIFCPIPPSLVAFELRVKRKIHRSVEVYSHLIETRGFCYEFQEISFIIIIGGKKKRKRKRNKKKKGKDGRLKKIEISKLSGIDFFVAFLNNFPPFYGRHPRFVEQIFKGSENRERRITNKSDRRCRQRAD